MYKLNTRQRVTIITLGGIKTGRGSALTFAQGGADVVDGTLLAKRLRKVFHVI